MSRCLFDRAGQKVWLANQDRHWSLLIPGGTSGLLGAHRVEIHSMVIDAF
jgi:hypothetical protein